MAETYIAQAELEMSLTLNKVKSILKSGNQSQDQGSLLLFEARVSDLEAVKTEFEAIYKRLFAYCGKSKIEFTQESFLEEFEISYYEIKALEKMYFSTKKNNKAVACGSNVLLPKIELINSKVMSLLAHTDEEGCVYCKGTHLLVKCTQYNALPARDKTEFIRKVRHCLNCLRPGHVRNQCKSSYTCRICKESHHTTLHEWLYKPSVSKVTTQHPDGIQSLVASISLKQSSNQGTSMVLLSTAQILALDESGSYQPCLALLDSGSQVSLITEACVQRLRLKRNRAQIPIHGLSNAHMGSSRGQVICTIKSRFLNPQTFDMGALIVPFITSTPTISGVELNITHLANLQMADPDYYRTRPVDLLIGADLFPHLLNGGRIVGEPCAINTVFGWTLIGRVDRSLPSSITNLCLSANASLDRALRKFWEVEEVPSQPGLSPEDEQCETSYSRTVSRDTAGRYVVALPFKEDLCAPEFPNMKEIAMRRFLSLERRMKLEPELGELYREYMRDFLAHGYMEPVAPIHERSVYYIPHHAVKKSESQIRVVYDASAKASNGTSLNDLLLSGPKLQRDITDILFNFRFHPIVFTADIRKMFLQVNVVKSQRDYQRILWRFSSDQSVSEYRLKTVTFGVSSSPFLAMRTLHQLVHDEGDAFPHASRVLLSDCYVDDIVTGASDLQTANNLKTELINILQAGGFQLRKWISNSPRLLESIPLEHQSPNSSHVYFDDKEVSFVKILGVRWDPQTDAFSYTVNMGPPTISKRAILSDIARIFDPMGWLSPVIIVAKQLIQHLWSIGLGWDEKPPDDVCTKWLRFKQEIPLLSDISLTRFISLNEAVQIQLHGFADSSEKAYAAVAYLRVVFPDGRILVNLLMSKSKVAPVKRVTLPRLELCAAHLLAKLLQSIRKKLSSISKQEITVCAWSDSQIALRWIQSSSHRWKTFVANRVASIQELIAPELFRYVPSKCNPADCASRGLDPSELSNHPLWWAGPPWLAQTDESWPITSVNVIQDTSQISMEARVVSLTNKVYPVLHLIERYSSLQVLQRVTAYCCRFAFNARHTNERRVGSLTTSELSEALLHLINLVQQETFSTELSHLHSGRMVPPRLRRLNPFIDDHGFLRVGGRLRNADLPFDHRYPLLLPKDHHFTNLIIDYYHGKYLHPGPQHVQCLIRQRYWILSDRDAIRKRVRKCMKCFRAHPPSLQPVMGNLPAARLQQIKPFKVCGVDYGGPFDICMHRGRKTPTLKAYICLFVCFSTKALHLEVASELTTEAFLAALRRFIARRGPISDIYSDCGTNFVGASRKLESWTLLTASSTHNTHVGTDLVNQQIKWHFNPPSAPHFGGLWEAGIKSVKRLLIRTVGDQRLTYEEFNTVLTQIEASLNSRPLCPLSSDPNDFAALTPAHFLMQGPATALLEPDLQKISSITRWHLLQQIVQSFWKRWKSEYLSTLQPRTRWTSPTPNINIGDMVVVRDNNLPNLQWKLARVVEVKPGKDGVIRVAVIRTTQGLVTRPVVKLCALPFK